MHGYYDEHGRLPPAVVYGKDGTALYSWRVLLLPYLEQRDLYEEFHRDEPWDSPSNLPLLERMPTTFGPPRNRTYLAPPGHTFIHVFTGKGTLFEDPQGGRLPDTVGRTVIPILLVEGGKAVPWTKPEDIPSDPDQPLPELFTVFPDVIRVAFSTGHVELLEKDTPEASLRAMITRTEVGK